MMLQWLKSTWFGSPMVEFESAFNLEESVARLRAATKKSVFSAMAYEQAVGTVKERRVSLQRVIPLVGNSFKPFFVGYFVDKDGKIVLRGCFRMIWLAKLFLTVWFGMLLLITIVGLASNIQSAKIWMELPSLIGLVGAGLGVVRLCQWFSRNDPAWLSNVIRAALGTQTPPATALVSNRLPARGFPIHLRAFASLIALIGLVMLVSGTIGIHMFQLDADGAVMVPFENGSLLRYWALASGCLLLAWAYGVFRRYLIAWWAGFGLLAYGGIDAIEWASQVQPLMIVEVIMSSLVLAFWGSWWYAQGIHFRN